MQGKNRLSAVLCSTDLDGSRDFYEQKVGLKLSPETIKNHLLFDCADGTTLLVYGRPAPNKADPSPSAWNRTRLKGALAPPARPDTPPPRYLRTTTKQTFAGVRSRTTL